MSTDEELPSVQMAAFQELIVYFEFLSEEAYSAAWMRGLEFELWRMLSEGPRRYGQLDVKDEHLDTLQEISARCGGWAYWSPVTYETYITFREWRIMYREWRRSESSDDDD